MGVKFTRDLAQSDVIVSDRFDVVLSSDHDAIFRALELALQGEEILIGF